MGQLSAKFRRWSRDDKAGLRYWCQGCEELHSVVIEGPGAWGFNGNPDAPTFTPSVLMRSGHFVPGQEGKECWCTFEERIGRKSPFECRICHTFITDGMVQFLGDCSHQYAGQTLPLPDLPDAHKDAVR